MMVASYLVGDRKYPIGYQLGKLGLYFLSALALWLIAIAATTGNNWLDLPLRALLLAVFAGSVLLVNRAWTRRRQLS